MSKAYSPSQTTTYMVCPVLWHNQYKAGEGGKGLYAPMTSRSFLPKLMGELLHTALRTWYALPLPTDQRVTAAAEAVGAAVEASKGASQGLVGRYAEVPWDGLAARIALLVQHYTERYESEAWQRILGVEMLLTAPSTMKLDLAVVDVDGEPTVVEHKYTGPKGTYEKAEYAIESAYRKWRRAYQPRHYAWGLSEAIAAGLFDGVTKPCRRVEMNFICETGLKTKPVLLARRTIEIEEQQLTIHKQMARGRWAAMEKAETDPDESVLWPNEEACDGRYGLCDFYDYCQSGWDDTVAQRLYMPKAGLRKEHRSANESVTRETSPA